MKKRLVGVYLMAALGLGGTLACNSALAAQATPDAGIQAQAAAKAAQAAAQAAQAAAQAAEAAAQAAAQAAQAAAPDDTTAQAATPADSTAQAAAPADDGSQGYSLVNDYPVPHDYMTPGEPGSMECDTCGGD